MINALLSLQTLFHKKDHGYLRLTTSLYNISLLQLFGFIRIVVIFIVATGCEKQYSEEWVDNEKVIRIDGLAAISNFPNSKDPDHNLVKYEEFLKYLVSSKRYLMVTQEEFETVNAPDKVIVSLRHDIDNNINGAIKMAYREHKYGIRATYYILHSADYYGVTKNYYFRRNEKAINYYKKLQETFGHEVSFHNDLVTLQVVYNIHPGAFLRQELAWLRANGISIKGSCTHGSPYCYIYHYLNTYFWRSSPSYGQYFFNYEFVYKVGNTYLSLPGGNMPDAESGPSGFENSFEDIQSQPATFTGSAKIQIYKDDRQNYGLDYDGDYLATDYNFSDVKIMGNGKRWHMGLEDFNKIPAGRKVIILIHPQFWD
jgi:hypothetical protein